MAATPLLSLVMIVKNEARAIRSTLDSVKPWIDRFTILDTGSTDGTQAIVHEAMAGVAGTLHEESFVDFGTTRSRALDLAANGTTFTLMLSGDETLVGGEALRRFCEAKRDAADGAYNVHVHYGPHVFDSARLARATSGWRYVGVTHEVLQKEGVPPPSTRVPDAHIDHDIGHKDAASQRQRWLLDQELLAAQALRSPQDTRTAFYLAQTLECLGLHDEAHAAYARRVALGGWREEVYESLFRLARTAGARGTPWPEVQQLYLDAHAYSSERAEPLHAIAWHWYQEKNWPLTYLFASRGAALPFPRDVSMFVQWPVYEHQLLELVAASAHGVGAWAEGRSALERVLEKRPNAAWLKDLLPLYDAPR